MECQNSPAETMVSPNFRNRMRRLPFLHKPCYEDKVKEKETNLNHVLSKLKDPSRYA